MHGHARLFLLATAISVAPPSVPAQDASTPVDPTALKAASLVLTAAFEDSGWEGFNGPREFVICSADGGTLYALREPPRHSPELSPLDSAGSDRLYHSPARPELLQRQCFRLNFVFEGRSILSFPQIDSVFTVSDGVEALAIALIHEEFHRFQGDSFGLMPRSGGDGVFHVLEKAVEFPDTTIASDRFWRSADEERRLLAEAIQESDSAKVRRLAREYVVMRTRRTEELSEDLWEGEAHVEWKEGTAHLVSYRMVTRAAGKPASDVVDLVHSDLLSTPALDRHPSQFRHWHVYATGAAIGLVLDKLGVSWRQEARAGEPLFYRLRDVIMTDFGSSVPNKR